MFFIWEVILTNAPQLPRLANQIFINNSFQNFSFRKMLNFAKNHLSGKNRSKVFEI